MSRTRTLASAVLAALAGLVGQGAEARDRVRSPGAVAAGVNQHNAVMNNINQARQQNNAVIDQVQNNIRASQQRPR